MEGIESIVVDYYCPLLAITTATIIVLSNADRESCLLYDQVAKIVEQQAGVKGNDDMVVLKANTETLVKNISYFKDYISNTAIVSVVFLSILFIPLFIVYLINGENDGNFFWILRGIAGLYNWFLLIIALYMLSTTYSQIEEIHQTDSYKKLMGFARN